MTHDPAVILRILKILAKTEQSACTPEESATAFDMASALMNRHGVKWDDLKNAHPSPGRPGFKPPNSQAEILLWYRQLHPNAFAGLLPAGLRELTYKLGKTKRIGTLKIDYVDVIMFFRILPNCPDGSWGFTSFDPPLRLFISPIIARSASRMGGQTPDTAVATLETEWAIEIGAETRKAKKITDFIEDIFGEKAHFA